MVLGESRIPGAGQGVFARRDLPPRTVAAFYNGLRVPVDERFPKLRFPPYCIKVGDVTDPCEEFIDLPVREGADTELYCASLGHKADSSPTVEWIDVIILVVVSSSPDGDGWCCDAGRTG